MRAPEVGIVVAKQSGDDTTWLQSFSEWRQFLYITDDPTSEYVVPAAKGNEAMVYLTFIIDHFDILPDIVIFHHANQFQWHNDDPTYDGRRVLSRLQLPYVSREGFVNLRCVWTVGCPLEIRPFEEELSGRGDRAGTFFKAAFEELVPELIVPDAVGAACCAQFAVTADAIRQRSREEYQHYRRWLLATPLEDNISGVIFEYMWHSTDAPDPLCSAILSDFEITVIFRRPSIHCPNAHDCYCRLYGLCELDCASEGRCDAQYTLPTTAAISHPE